MTSRNRAFRYLSETVNRSRRCDDAGDTLVELLIAMTIIAISVAGLLGGLATDIGSSGTHRGITTLDGIVRSFAEEARQVVELDPQAQFTPCGSSAPAYRMVSAPYPSIGSTNTAVTVFGTGFTPGGAISSVWLEPTSGSRTGAVQAYPGSAPPTPLQAAPAPTSPTTTFGNTTVTFLVPSGLTIGTNYYVALTDSAGLQAISSVPFIPESAAATPVVDPSPLQDYTLGITKVTYWSGSDVSATSCSPTNGLGADLQQLTIAGTAPGEHDTYNVVVTSPVAFKAGESIPITYAGPANPALGDTLTYTASVTGNSGYSGYASPSGSLTWFVIPPSGPSTSCSTTAPSSPTWTLPAGSTPTCSFKAMAAGTYSVYAKYTGDTNYLVGVGQCPPLSGTCNPKAIGKATPSLTVAGTSSGGLLPTITFKATVSGTGNTPTGSIEWVIKQSGKATSYCSSPSTLNASGQTTCTITTAPPGSYIATVTYDPTTTNDPNYNPTGPVSSNAVNVALLSASVSLSESVTGSSLVVTATVTGPLGSTGPTGSVTWSSGLCSSTSGNSLKSGQASCTIKNPSNVGYFGTFAYDGDTNYSATSTAVNIPITSWSYSTGTASLTFMLTVTGPLVGPAPVGPVSWNVTSGKSSVPCVAQPTTATANSATFSCMVTPASPTALYTASATYGSDPNYLPPYPNPTQSQAVNG